MSDPARYTVGWICALLVEYVAAQEFLDEEHEKPSFVSPNDANNYTLGKIAEHNVVIAVLPDGDYGTASAASVAANMLNTFHNIRIGLMVGIGGGVPSKNHDIRLGDVVVSASRGGEGGVFQYDFGKSIQGQTFQYTRVLNQPPPILLTAIMGIQAAYERKGHDLQTHTEQVLDNNPRLRPKYGRPPANMDRLFKSEVVHSLECHDMSCADDPSKLVPRRERGDVNAAIHYGLVASGNQLMKDALLRDRLAAERDVLCFETEASGLMNTFPCLVIRGICDYSDSHKNKIWQGHAALVAAAYAKDLLREIAPNRMEAETRITMVLSETLEGTNQLLGQMVNQQAQYCREQKQRALTDQQRCCLQAFSITNYVNQKELIERRAEGTCLWALQSPEYIHWSESTCHNLLWVSADPGCGKSVLARAIVDDYLEDISEGVAVCYFFFKDDNEEQNHLVAALCSVLHQFFSQRHGLLRHAIPSWENYGEKLQQQVEELWRIFIKAASDEASGKTICIFDALDECRAKDQKTLIEFLRFFLGEQSSSTQHVCLKFLITSRPYDSMQRHFRKISDSFSHLHLKGEEENDGIRKEIDLVVKQRVTELARETGISREIQQQLEQHLLGMEHRTYLWLHLAIDEIQFMFEKSLRSDEETLASIQTSKMIPGSVNEAYDKILSRVCSNEDQSEQVKKILQFIVAARRPLTTMEMAMVLGIADRPQIRTAAEARIDSSLIAGKLRRICGPFVFINKGNIYLIHQTAREFLIAENNVARAYSWRLNDAEKQMARICLQYLLMKDLVRDDGTLRSNTRDFFQYAAVHWPYHVREMGPVPDQEVVEQVHRLYDTSGKLFPLWFPVFWKAARPHKKLPIMGALHLAAFNGHEQEVVFRLGAQKRDIHVPDSTRSYAIEWAALNAHGNVVQTLLDHGAQTNAQGGYYGYALEAACCKGHEEIVHLLLKRGANVNAQGGRYGNALQAACAMGHEKIARILLEKGANVNARGGFYGTALQAACVGGNDKIVRELLGHGADLNARGGRYDSPLQAACYQGQRHIFRILLAHGAKSNIWTQDRHGRTPLHAAVIGGHLDICQKLAVQGANVNHKNIHGSTPLHEASYHGHIHICEFLLEKNAQAGIADHQGRSPLHLAAKHGHIEVARILLKHDAGAAETDETGWTPLHIASQDGDIRLVELILQVPDIVVDVKDKTGRTPLFLAASRGRSDVLRLLISFKADPHALDRYNSTPLCSAIRNGHLEAVQILLPLTESPIHFNDGLGRNLAWWAKSTGSRKIIDLVWQWAQRMSIKITESDFTAVPKLLSHGKSRTLCDVCTRFVPYDSARYRCRCCHDFDICLECHRLGVQCFDPRHTWEYVQRKKEWTVQRDQ